MKVPEPVLPLPLYLHCRPGCEGEEERGGQEEEMQGLAILANRMGWTTGEERMQDLSKTECSGGHVMSVALSLCLSLPLDIEESPHDG